MGTNRRHNSSHVNRDWPPRNDFLEWLRAQYQRGDQVGSLARRFRALEATGCAAGIRCLGDLERRLFGVRYTPMGDAAWHEFLQPIMEESYEREREADSEPIPAEWIPYFES